VQQSEKPKRHKNKYQHGESEVKEGRLYGCHKSLKLKMWRNRDNCRFPLVQADTDSSPSHQNEMYSSASNCVGMIAVTTLLQPFAALR
jgi:hypothetical protein